MAKKLGFALGSGGSRGVAHIGFLMAMEEEGIKPDFIAGCSMGAVVGAIYASGMSPKNMRKEVLKLKFSEIFDLSLNPIGSGALLRAKKMRKKLATYLGDKKISDLDIPFSCVALDLVSGNVEVLDGETSVVEAVASSSSIPGVFRPVQMGEKMLVDGGVKCRVPIKQVKDMGADVVVAVDVLGELRKNDRKYNMLSVLFRVFDIMDCEVTCQKTKKEKPDLYLIPELGDMIQYKFKDMEKAIEIGYELGKENAPYIKNLI
jgi:NTE family protein